jgi:hypothetical protein
MVLFKEAFELCLQSGVGRWGVNGVNCFSLIGFGDGESQAYTLDGRKLYVVGL